MYKDLIKRILGVAGITQAVAATRLGYNSPAGFHAAINNKEIKLTVLYNICKLCGFNIIITNGKGITISIGDYISEQQHP